MLSVAQSTMTTTSTVLSVLAGGEFEAAPELRSMASSIASRASSRAAASRPANFDAAATTVRETVTQGAVGSSDAVGREVEVSFVFAGVIAVLALLC